VRLRPQHRGSGERINAGFFPPLGLIATPMKLAVVTTAKRYRELVAHLASESPVLRKPKVVGIRRLPFTDEARLCGDEFDVDLVPHPARLRHGQAALIDGGIQTAAWDAFHPTEWPSVALGNQWRIRDLGCPRR
jgi:hypothetical protein